MRLYIGIAKTSAALCLAAALFVGAASAVPLPSTPPEVDSTPASHEQEPEDFRNDVQLPMEIPEPSSQAAEPPLQPVNRTPPQPDRPEADAGIDTGSILLIGAAIWYVITIIGIAGGRRGVPQRRKRTE